MPPRSYYIEPRAADYVAFANSFCGDDAPEAVDFIERNGLPFIRNTDHLAAYVGVSSSLIRQILHKKSYHYRQFDLPKPDGTCRQISTPKTYLKVLQWWISDNILCSAPINDCAHGFVRGRSYVTNANAHLGARHLLNVDIKGFFPSITQDMIDAVFRSLGYSDDGARLLADICSLGGVAPTGAPTSPSIGNAILSNFDDAMIDAANSAGLTYTRYADDLTFSSRDFIGQEFVENVSALVLPFGFELNDRKTRFMGPGDRMEVTGVTINNSPSLSREWRNFARGYLHRVLKNPVRYQSEWKRVAGVYGTLKALDPTGTRKLTRNARKALRLVKPKAR